MTPDFYLGQTHTCSYLPPRVARSVFLDPGAPPDHATYSVLVNHGFRRSGNYVYRPQCAACDACVPLRLPVGRFHPRRSERRCVNLNHDLTVREVAPHFSDEYFDLYTRYQKARHPGGGMDEPEEGEFLDFLAAPWSPTRFFEFRAGGRLLAVAVADLLLQGWSAVYTFFEPREARRGLGTYALLWEIGACRRSGGEWLYLGYWIEACPKMAYKGRFSGAEIFRDQRWQPLSGAQIS